MTSLVDLQARLLDNAISMLAPDGILIYCTCSLQKDEGERQIERILFEHRNLERVPVRAAELGGIGDIVAPNGDVRVFPSHLGALGGMDGFFVSRLRKRSG